MRNGFVWISNAQNSYLRILQLFFSFKLLLLIREIPTRHCPEKLIKSNIFETEVNSGVQVEFVIDNILIPGREFVLDFFLEIPVLCVPNLLTFNNYPEEP